MIIVAPSSSKSSVSNFFFRSHENERPALSNSSVLKSVYEKLRISVDGRKA